MVRPGSVEQGGQAGFCVLDGPAAALLLWRRASSAMGVLLPHGRTAMAWSRPKLREICIGLEINAYMASEL